MLTAGNVSDVKAAPALLERGGRMRHLLADKGYDADRLRRSPGVAAVRDDVRRRVLAGELNAPVAADVLLSAYDRGGL